MYEIRLCKNNELELLKKFLRNSWSKDHIFLKNIEILDFQHKTQEGYNFVVAYHLETKCFHGVLGIISPDFYTNRKLSKNQDIWIAIWKVDKKLSQSNSIGFDMIEYVKKEFIPKFYMHKGINPLFYLSFSWNSTFQRAHPHLRLSIFCFYLCFCMTAPCT